MLRLLTDAMLANLLTTLPANADAKGSLINDLEPHLSSFRRGRRNSDALHLRRSRRFYVTRLSGCKAFVPRAS
jgi:hypothetical protein